MHNSAVKFAKALGARTVGAFSILAHAYKRTFHRNFLCLQILRSFRLASGAYLAWRIDLMESHRTRFLSLECPRGPGIYYP